MERANERPEQIPEPLSANTPPKSKVQTAKEDLVVLNVEKEIAEAIVTLVQQRLNNAETEGQVSEDFRVQLEQKYIADVLQLEKKIAQRKKIVQLYDLEKTQNSLIQSFNEKLEALNKEILNIRSSLGIEQKEGVKLPLSESHQSLSGQLESSPEMEAEQKLETIQEDVLKLFDKLKPKAGTK
jgi:ATP-dependent RNA circularization protein (DNA/RNA ligase family)